MAKIDEILEVHRTMADSLSQRMTEFEQKLKSTTGENTKPSVDKLASDFKEFKTSVWNILALLRSLIVNLAAQIDEVDNRARKNILLFGGIEEAEGENLLSTVLSTIQVLMGLSEVHTSAVQYCHRLGVKTNNRPRPILVRFNDLGIKNLIWNNKKKLKSSSVILSEFLTKPRQSMFIKARKHFGITNVWTRNGNIFIKLPNNERRRIFIESDLDDVMLKFPSLSSGQSLGTSPSAERPKISPVSTGPTVRPVTRKNTVRKHC